MLTTLTMNCFGVPALGTVQRLRALGASLNALDADVITLQEVQAHAFRRLLIKSCTAYPYREYAPFVHAPKGGLLTLSRHPLTEWRFVLYRERGLWYTPALADWILHKGVLITHIRIGELPVVVMNTHLTANYTGDWSRGNRFARHEWEQLAELADLVNEQPPDHLVVVAGDFNVPRGSWLADEFLQRSGLTDPLSGNTRPTYRPMAVMPARYATAIDFNLYRAPQGIQVEAQARFRFEQKHRLADGSQMFLSDHDAVEARLRW